jgi:two-component system, response regulator
MSTCIQNGPLVTHPVCGEIITVLLADDDEDDRMMTADALREARISNKLHFVTDGEELIDYLYHRGKYAPPAHAPRPDLLLLDLNMPRKDGREALREMKENPAFRSIPVLVLTTSKTEEDVERIYDLGANSFITKPVTFEGLVQAMKVIGEYWFQIVRLPKAADNG